MASKRSADSAFKYRDVSSRKIARTKESAHVPRRDRLNQKNPETVESAKVGCIPEPTPLQKSNITPPTIDDATLQDAPFTHASVLDSKYGKDTHATYERLEFLGDAYLEVIATRIIYSRFPQLLTGQQARLRESLVRNSTLAGFARQFQWGDRIRIAKSEKQSNVQEKILADVFEAYVAAVILADPENGFTRVEAWLLSLWTEQLLAVDASPIVNRKDELARLVVCKETKIEYLPQGKGWVTPDKSTQQNRMGVYFTGWGREKVLIGSAVGVGKTEAGILAASEALQNPIVQELAETKRKHDEARKKARISEENCNGE